jgi:hypothetical protein
VPPLPVEAPREPSGASHSVVTLDPACLLSDASHEILRSSLQTPMSVGLMATEQVTGTGLSRDGPKGMELMVACREVPASSGKQP